MFLCVCAYFRKIKHDRNAERFQNLVVANAAELQNVGSLDTSAHRAVNLSLDLVAGGGLPCTHDHLLRGSDLVHFALVFEFHSAGFD